MQSRCRRSPIVELADSCRPGLGREQAAFMLVASQVVLLHQAKLGQVPQSTQSSPKKGKRDTSSPCQRSSCGVLVGSHHQNKPHASAHTRSTGFHGVPRYYTHRRVRAACRGQWQGPGEGGTLGRRCCCPWHFSPSRRTNAFLFFLTRARTEESVERGYPAQVARKKRTAA